MIGSLGATEVVIYTQTSTPFPAVAPAANTTEWYDVAQAMRASERGHRRVTGGGTASRTQDREHD
jgi:hypothetical protein